MEKRSCCCWLAAFRALSLYLYSHDRPLCCRYRDLRGRMRLFVPAGSSFVHFAFTSTTTGACRTLQFHQCSSTRLPCYRCGSIPGHTKDTTDQDWQVEIKLEDILVVGEMRSGAIGCHVNRDELCIIMVIALALQCDYNASRAELSPGVPLCFVILMTGFEGLLLPLPLLRYQLPRCL